MLRAVSNVVLRDLNVTFVMDAMRRGTPIVYVDMVDYDELAHHAGPERLETLRSLAGVDRVLGSLRRAAASAPRDYRIVVVSDHGQSQGATFKDRYGATLAEVIEGLMGGGSASPGGAEQGEGWGPVNALLSEIRSRPGVAGRVASSVLESRTVDGAVDMGAKKAAKAPAPADATVMVLASGNLANAYFTGLEGRASLERLEATYPGLLTGLAAHPGIGFILVRSETLGAVALGPAGARYLDDDRVEGVDPLALFGPNAADHLRRLDGFTNVGDLLINSSYDAELEEVAAFEELVGSHGGFGGPQTRPFLLAPADLPFEDGPIVGAPAVHRQLVRWADALGVGPGSGAGDSPVVEDRHLPEPTGIKWVSALLVLTSVPAILFAGVILVLEVVSADVNALATAAIVVALLIAVASIGLAVGLLKRRRWAWFVTLAPRGDQRGGDAVRARDAGPRGGGELRGPGHGGGLHGLLLPDPAARGRGVQAPAGEGLTRFRPLRGVPFGMYAEVETPGRVAVGDAVVALPERACRGRHRRCATGTFPRRGPPPP